MLKQEEILNLIKLKGPLLPMLIAKEANLSLLFAGAFLAELTETKKAIASKIKVGSSPLYYVEGQESKLQNYTKYLEPKEQTAIALLRDNKVLCDRELEPSIRVALRNTIDFAVPIKVNLKSESELYWKWYLTANAEAELMIRQDVTNKSEREKQLETAKLQAETVQAMPQAVPQVMPQAVQQTSVSAETVAVVESKPAIQEQQPAVKLPKSIAKRAQKTLKEPVSKPEVKSELKGVVLEKPKKIEIQEPAVGNSAELEQKQPAQKKKTKLLQKKKTVQKESAQKELETEQVKSKPVESVKPESVKPKPIETQSGQTTLAVDSLYEKVKNNFESSGISIMSHSIVLPEKELDLVVKVPTVIGEVTYFCKAKKKASNTEADLFNTILAAQQKGLPGLFATTGKINKKAKDLLDSQPNAVKFINLK